MSNMKVWYALATFVGTVVGVGVFSLPYVTAQSSFLVAMGYLVALGGVFIIIQLAYSQVVLATPARHQAPGYAARYLGESWRPLTFVIQTLGVIGGSLAHVIIGGRFLWLLASPWWGGSPVVYVFIYFALGSFLVLLGVRSIARSEFLMLFFMVALVIFFVVVSGPGIDWSLVSQPTLGQWFLPYGPMLFSLWGVSIVPEIAEIIGNQRRHLPAVLSGGLVIVVGIYALFIMAVFGVTGSQSSPDALSALAGVWPSYAIAAALVFGLLATFTSFISLAAVTSQSLIEDYRVSRFHAWLAACFPPLILYLAGAQNFVTIIGVTGAVMLALFGVVVLMMYQRLTSRHFPSWLIYGLIVVLVGGAVAEIISLLK